MKKNGKKIIQTFTFTFYFSKFLSVLDLIFKTKIKLFFFDDQAVKIPICTKYMDR